MKLTVAVLPELHVALGDYGETYGREEPVAELIPAVLAAVLDSDRGLSGRARHWHATGRMTPPEEVDRLLRIDEVKRQRGAGQDDDLLFREPAALHLRPP